MRDFVHPTVIRLSKEDSSNKRSIDAFRRDYGEAILKQRIEPLPGHPLDFESTVYNLPDLGLATGTTSPAVFPRTTNDIDGDNLVLNVSLSGKRIVQQLNRELAVDAGEASLTTSTEVGIVRVPETSRFISFRVPRKILQPMVTDLDAHLVRPLPRNSDALRLLINYAGIVKDANALTSLEMRHIVVAHFHDILAIVLGATRDATDAAGNRGLREARMHAVKSDIKANLVQRDLSLATVATRIGISPRYARRLLAEDGTSFAEFVLGARLTLAHRRLSDPRQFGRLISMIAFECGFGDLSYFNHSFKRRYGETPSDVRETARRQIPD